MTRIQAGLDGKNGLYGDGELEMLKLERGPLLRGGCAGDISTRSAGQRVSILFLPTLTY
jgi:hypothetical protein